MLVEKAKMMTKDITQENVAKIRELFPNAVTETNDGNGNIRLVVDFDVLKQELSDSLITDKQERYQMSWPDKKQAILLANKGVVATLRPVFNKSVNFNNTQNVYVEGDNFDVLKLLRETYLGKIKMIYIDPPYNTGSDFVYNDDFSRSEREYLDNSGQYDELGNKLVSNSESNGRFHTDWLNMMYPRLKVAKDLLCDDGLICVSIDDNEQGNLVKIMDEIFGEQNFESCIKWRRRSNQPNDATKMVATVSEYILIYAKNSAHLKETKRFGTVELNEERLGAYTNPDNDPKGPWSTTPWCASKGQGGSKYSITTPTGRVYTEIWLGTEETFKEHLRNGRIYWTANGDGKPRKKVYKSEAIEKGQAAIDFWVGEKFGDNLSATSEMKQLFGLDRVFDYTKPVKLLENLIKICAPGDNDYVLDFFSGSSTTAHALMNVNASKNTHKKFIMVQLPEKCDENSEAKNAGYETICDIGEERIRRAGKIILEHAGLLGEGLDVGFRVFKLDSSNMNEVYYNPKAITQNLLEATVDNIKPDRTPSDLLFQIMLECGALLSSKIEEKTISGKKVFVVEDNYIAACFDDEVDDKTVEAIAKLKPIYACFKGSSFNSDSANINAEQIFKTYSPNTEKIKVI